MFCDGRCVVSKETPEGTVTNRCGLFVVEHLVNDRQEHKDVERCIFIGIRNSLANLNQRSIGIQAAVESERNEEVKSSLRVNQTLAQGMLGLIYAMGDDEKKTKVVNMLKQVEAQVTQGLEAIEKEEEEARQRLQIAQ